MALNLPTVAQVNAQPHATPKHAIVPHQIAKKATKLSREEQAKAFRDAVWKRDKGCSRATGKRLTKSGTTDWAQLGEVDHAIPRSLAPERIYDVSNGLLLSKEENRLRKVCCRLAPEYRVFDYTGPENRALPQTFLWRDDSGRVIKTRIG